VLHGDRAGVEWGRHRAARHRGASALDSPQCEWAGAAWRWVRGEEEAMDGNARVIIPWDLHNQQVSSRLCSGAHHHLPMQRNGVPSRAPLSLSLPHARNRLPSPSSTRHRVHAAPTHMVQHSAPAAKKIE
jgi:hypothetical protein